VGVNSGRAFTENPCLAAEWRAAPAVRSVYLNSGYKPENAARTTALCRQLGRYQAAPDAARTAYAIGCSETAYSALPMRAAGADRSAVVWIDVEGSNSWDAADLNLNRYALQGEIDQLAASGRLVGLYSTAGAWHGIFG